MQCMYSSTACEATRMAWSDLTESQLATQPATTAVTSARRASQQDISLRLRRYAHTSEMRDGQYPSRGLFLLRLPNTVAEPGASFRSFTRLPAALQRNSTTPLQARPNRRCAIQNGGEQPYGLDDGRPTKRYQDSTSVCGRRFASL
jgi:hypothetical protein